MPEPFACLALLSAGSGGWCFARSLYLRRSGDINLAVRYAFIATLFALVCAILAGEPFKP